jgi:hypothetical protein
VFGSDASPCSREVNVPATYWLGAQTALTAPAVALAEMVSAGEITETKALLSPAAISTTTPPCCSDFRRFLSGTRTAAGARNYQPAVRIPACRAGGRGFEFRRLSTVLTLSHRERKLRPFDSIVGTALALSDV